MFFKRKEIDGRKTVIDIDGFYRESKSVPNGWCDVAGSDVTLVSAALFIEFGMKLSEVKQYIQLKKIRNTQVARGGKGKEHIQTTMLVDFYHQVIYPMVKNN